MAAWVMKRICSMIPLLLLSVILVASMTIQMVKAEPSIMRWTRTYGGASDDWGRAMVQTGDGGYALAGTTYSFGAGDYDFWLVKTNANGDMQWNKTYGGTGTDEAWALVQTSDGGYALTGQTNFLGANVSDFWLIKTDGNGNSQWDKRYGKTGSAGAHALVQTSDGGYALTGDASGFWLVKTDAYGNAQWNKTYGTVDYQAWALVQTSDGGYALAGYNTAWDSALWLIKTDGNGNTSWNQTYGGVGDDRAFALVQTSDGGYALAGYTTSFGAGYIDFWLVKTDADGVVPEFPSFPILAAFMMAILVTIIVYKRKHVLGSRI